MQEGCHITVRDRHKVLFHQLGNLRHRILTQNACAKIIDIFLIIRLEHQFFGSGSFCIRAFSVPAGSIFTDSIFAGCILSAAARLQRLCIRTAFRYLQK